MTRERRSRLFGAALVTLWLAAVLVIDVATREVVVLAVLYALAPLIACAVLPPAATAGFGLVAIALAIGSDAESRTPNVPQMWVRAVDAVLVSTAAVAIAAVRTRRERQYARMANLADVAQRAVLPTLPGRIGPVAVAARYLSAAQDALVGGDLYDCFHNQREATFIVGDVRGKGVPAVEQAARVIRAFRQSAAAAGDLAVVARRVSDYLVPFLDDEEFVTAALVRVAMSGQLTLVSCGHPPPLLLRHGGGAELVEPPAGLPLGLGASYEAVTIRWAAGDRLLVYTDGLSEARDRSGDFMPLLPLAPLLAVDTIETALDGVLDELRRYVPGGRLNDDLAVLLLENLCSGVPPAQPRAHVARGAEPLARAPR